MKKTIANTMSCLAMIALSATFLSATPQKDEVMTKENGMYVINTTTLGKNVTGYVSTTPLKIYIKKMNEAQKKEVDGITGATFSSDAVKANVKLGLDYYKSHK